MKLSAALRSGDALGHPLPLDERQLIWHLPPRHPEVADLCSNFGVADAWVVILIELSIELGNLTVHLLRHA